MLCNNIIAYNGTDVTQIPDLPGKLVSSSKLQFLNVKNNIKHYTKSCEN